MGFTIQDLLGLLPGYRATLKENRKLKAKLEEFNHQHAEWMRFSPPGHFYSPLPSIAEIDLAFKRGNFGPPFLGVDLNEQGQFARIERFLTYYADQPFRETPTEGRRFHLGNTSYGHYDAIMLYCMLREANTRRVIEVGSGFSSAAMLDASEHALPQPIDFTFIDPDMSRLRPLLHPADAERCTLLPKCVQDVPLDVFDRLQANDVLFIDSSHVSKIGSDVNRIFFDIIPRLAPGVLIHIHDVAGNLDYPRDWLEEGRAWNEQYLLRAFLMFNSGYRMELFTSWLMNVRHAWFCEHMPLCARGGGGQMWLRKL